MRSPEQIDKLTGPPGFVLGSATDQRPAWPILSKAAYATLLLAFFALENIRAAEDGSDEKIPPLRPAKAIIPPSFWEQYAAWVIAFGAVLAALLGVLIWWLGRPKPPILVAPAVQAHHALGELRQTPETGMVLSKVSQIVRTYFGAAFGLPPGEYTTTEFSRAISAREEVGTSLKEDVNGFLRLCDERKFAPTPPSSAMGAIQRADELIERAEARRSELEGLAQRNDAKPETAAPRQTSEPGPGAKS